MKETVRNSKTVLITGAYGFIGSNLAKRWLWRHPGDKVVLLDGMTYAARPDYLFKAINENSKRALLDYSLVEIDIRDHAAVARTISFYKPDLVFHLAAESHVCRSIAGPKAFMETNVMGTFNLIEEFYQLWKGKSDKLFVHVSTDEVFGELEDFDPPFNENTNIKPRSPYAASKASSDHIIQCYHHTYGVPTIITNCSNNFGPNQHEEKLIPNTILRTMRGEPALLHGDGGNVRDWLFVEDHCRALEMLSEKGKAGERYCIGGNKELTNKKIVQTIQEMVCGMVKIKTGKDLEPRIIFSNDRPTDDRRYAINTAKINELGWQPYQFGNFMNSLHETVSYYWDDVFIKKEKSPRPYEGATI